MKFGMYDEVLSYISDADGVVSSKYEIMFVFYLIKNIKKDTKKYYFYIRDMYNFFGLSKKTDFSSLYNILENKIKVFKTKNIDIVLNEDEAEISIDFNNEINTLFFEVKKIMEKDDKFNILFNIKNKREMLFYLFVILNDDRNFQFTILELKTKFGLRKDDYENFGNLNNKILFFDDFNKITDYKIEKELIRRRKRVKFVKLKITKNNKIFEKNFDIDTIIDVDDKLTFRVIESFSKRNGIEISNIEIIELVSLGKTILKNNNDRLVEIFKETIEFLGEDKNKCYDFVLHQLKAIQKYSTYTK